MNYRNAVLLAAKTGLTSGVETVDLDLADPLTRIQILVYASNVDDIPDGHPAALVVKAEIVDGSEVIYSLEGRQAQAMSFYDRGKMDQNGVIYMIGRTGWACISLNFGRFLYDPDYALDPKKFRNPQLKIQYLNTGGLSSIASLGLKVMGDVFDEKAITPVGYLLSKEEFKFTPASGTVRYIDLPVDMPIRKLVIISPSPTADISDQAGTPKIDEDDGKRVLFDLGAADVKRWVQQHYGIITEGILAKALTGGEEIYLTQGSGISTAAVPFLAATGYITRTLAAGCRPTFVATSADGWFEAIVSGICPHGSYPFLFGDQNDPADWWDVTKIGAARLQLTPTTSVETGTDVSVLTQRLARY